MPCYPLYFGASIDNAVHHRFSLKTCIKLKQQKLYCHLIWYCHFQEFVYRELQCSYHNIICVCTSGRFPKPFTKRGAGRLVEILPPAACTGRPACIACCTPSVGNKAPWFSQTRIFLSHKCHTAFNIYPVQITIIKVSFSLLPEMD